MTNSIVLGKIGLVKFVLIHILWLLLTFNKWKFYPSLQNKNYCLQIYIYIYIYILKLETLFYGGLQLLGRENIYIYQ